MLFRSEVAQLRLDLPYRIPHHRILPCGRRDNRETIKQQDFGKLVWDASKTDGGSFTFEVLDAQDRVMHDPQGQKVTHTVSIDEHAVAGNTLDLGALAAAGTHSATVAVGHNTITWMRPDALEAQTPGELRYFKVFSEITATQIGRASCRERV